MFKLINALENTPNHEIFKEVACHLSQLENKLTHHFPHFACYAYSTNPFFDDSANAPVGTAQQEEIIDSKTDDTAEAKLEECCSTNF